MVAPETRALVRQPDCGDDAETAPYRPWTESALWTQAVDLARDEAAKIVAVKPVTGADCSPVRPAGAWAPVWVAGQDRDAVEESLHSVVGIRYSPYKV